MDLRDKDRTTLGYTAAIGVSALVHAVFLYVVLFALPQWLKADQTPPPAYTVAIVDNLPAGDLGTHLPRLSGKHGKSVKLHRPRETKPPEKVEEHPPRAGTPAEAPNTDLKALALNNATASAVATPEPTASPTPTPAVVETPEPTAAPTEAPTQAPTARPTRRPRPTMRPRPTPAPRPQARRHNRPPRPPEPKVKPKVMLARVRPIPKAARTMSVKERLAALHKQLEEEQRQQSAKARAEASAKAAATAEDEDEGDETTDATHAEAGEGGGPVAGTSATNGRGFGVGPGTGSAGILKDPEFLLYYQKVQERIKNAWSYAGGNKNLTTTVNFAIAPDGRLTGLEIAQSSNNASFDQSVLRAIRLAAPFPAPPEDYREQFSQGVQAVFELGELRS